MNGSQYDESDSGKSYKRKLQKQLFIEPSDVSPPRSRVKREAASDACDASSDELDALRGRVKQEECTPTPRKKKKRRETESQTATEYVEEMKIEKTPNKRKLSQCSNDNATLTRLVKEEDTRKSKSKKLKRKKDSEASTDNDRGEMVIEDKFSAEETVVQTHNRNYEENDNNKTKNTYSSKEFISDESSSDENSVKVDIEVNHHKKADSFNNNHASAETSGSDSDHLANGTSFNDQNLLTPTTSTTTKASHKTLKLSDRIQFEDEEDLRPNNNDSIDNNVWSSRFKCFIKSRSHLKSVPQIQHECSITNDDEIWVLKCPREMDIMSLSNTDILLDNKAKIKIDGQTFIGSIDEEINRMAILSFEHNKAVINNISSNGTVCFHKRIPKAHFIEENIIVNNQTNFIPLPDTKSRHPLFGSNYKRAMKIPTSIRARLKAVDTEPVAASPKTKKKKKHKKEPGWGADAQGPRPSKRPPADLPQPPTKKQKRSKHDSLAAEAWDSEKAIEENLFNF